MERHIRVLNKLSDRQTVRHAQIHSKTAHANRQIQGDTDVPTIVSRQHNRQEKKQSQGYTSTEIHIHSHKHSIVFRQETQTGKETFAGIHIHRDTHTLPQTHTNKQTTKNLHTFARTHNPFTHTRKQTLLSVDL